MAQQTLTHPHPTTSVRRSPFRWKPDQNWEAYLFLLPSFAGFFVFVALPVLASLALSFVEWNLIRAPEFVGIANYQQLLTRDPVFGRVVWNSAFFIVTIVPLQLIFGLAIAVRSIRLLVGALFTASSTSCQW